MTAERGRAALLERLQRVQAAESRKAARDLADKLVELHKLAELRDRIERLAQDYGQGFGVGPSEALRNRTRFVHGLLRISSEAKVAEGSTRSAVDTALTRHHAAERKLELIRDAASAERRDMERLAQWRESSAQLGLARKLKSIR